MDKTIKALPVLACFMLCGAMAHAQSTFNGQIVPGLSTKDDVEAMLGKPVSQVNATISEYKAPAGYKTVRIQFDQSSTVMRIGATFPAPQSKSSLMQQLHFSGSPQRSLVIQGALSEFYGDPVFLQLNYTATTSDSGVKSMIFETPDAFKSDVAAAGSAPPASASQPAPSAPPPTASASPATAGTRPAAAPPPSSSGLKRSSAAPASPLANTVGCLQNVTLNLLTPINSATSKPNDKVILQAFFPLGIRQDIVSGHIISLNCGANSGAAPGCDLYLAIDTLSHQGQEFPLDALFVSMANSHGATHMDDEGNVVNRVEKGGYQKVLAQEAMMASNGGNSNGPVLRTAIELTTYSAQFSLAAGTWFRFVLHSRTAPIPELQCGADQNGGGGGRQ